MSIETRLRDTGLQGGGGSANSAGLAGTGGSFILNSGNSLFPDSRILRAGSSVTLASDATAVYVSATTGAAGGGISFQFPSAPGSINLGSSNFISVYSS